MNKNLYVTMTDKFMSGWGQSENKINKLILVCDNYQQALIVEENAKNRGEMKYINICTNKPSYNSNNYFVSLHDINDYSSWYKKGNFRK